MMIKQKTVRAKRNTKKQDTCYSYSRGQVVAMPGAMGQRRPLRYVKHTPDLTLTIVGLGYVGAVSAACFASRGHSVIGIDLDPLKVNAVNEGRSEIVENGLDTMLKSAVLQGKLSACSDIFAGVSKSDVTLVSVGTPTNQHGVCNLSYLRACCKKIGEALKTKTHFHTVVIRSTIPPKTCRDIVIPILEKSSGLQHGADFGVCFNPEFLRESCAIDDFNTPAKTVIGCDDKMLASQVLRLYEGLPGEFIVTSLEAAEFVKYIDNTWHAMKVGFANEVGRVCTSMDIDSQAVMDIFVQDKKLNLSAYYMRPGNAFGGSCLPKDTRGMAYLAQRHGVRAPLISNIISSNEQQIDFACEKVLTAGARKVGIIGISFKDGTDDLRESPTLNLMQRLLDRGLDVRFYDPNVSQEKLDLLDLPAPVKTGRVKHFFGLIRSVDILVVTHNGPYARNIAKLAQQHCQVLDLVGLDRRFKGNPNYQGLCW